MVTTESVDISY